MMIKPAPTTAVLVADLQVLRGAIQAPTRGEEWVPPPRFAAKSFANYRLDPAIAGQAEAVTQVQAFAAQRRRWRFLPRRRTPPGLYLDGGFGVGKTHLLAAAFHAAPGTRRYASFAEAISLIILLGGRAAAELLAADLVCIDEFELDDPANTRLADLLLEELVARGSRILTTSNTVSGELGQGRMAADQFRNQLARIADRFIDVHVPGTDHRRRADASASGPHGWGPDPSAHAAGVHPLLISVDELDAVLRGIPIANLRRLAMALPTLTITGMRPFTDQLSALRFVNFIDRCYEQECSLRVVSAAADVAIDAIFPDEHCQRAFAKKYRRCQSRLIEMCST